LEELLSGEQAVIVEIVTSGDKILGKIGFIDM